MQHTDQLKGALRTKVETQAEQIRFSYFLATIRTDVPIVLDWNALAKQDPDTDALYALYRRLEFNSLLPKTDKTLRAGQGTAITPASSLSSTKKETPSTLQLDLFGDTSAPSQPEPVAQPFNGSLMGISGEHFNDSLMGSDGDSQQPINEHPELVQYLLNPEVAYNPECPPSIDALRRNEKLWRLYTEVELPLVSVLRDMEAAGVRIDTDRLGKAERQLTDELHAIEQQIASYLPAEWHTAGKTLNVNSPSQVGELLFDTLRLDPKAKKTKTGAYSTSEEVLQGLRDAHPIVPLILDYRELRKLISTYVAALPTYIDPRDGKIHTTYNQTTTATGRLSSSNPNLQNLPIRSERGNSFVRRLSPMRAVFSCRRIIRR